MKQRLGGQTPDLITSDEAPAYATTIENTFSEPIPPAPGRRSGRPRIMPKRRLPGTMSYATVHKHREHNRVVAVDRRLIFRTPCGLAAALGQSVVSQSVNTSFVERRHATDRGRNARKTRQMYRFSKAWTVHEAMTYFTLYRDNFCWTVRTLRVRGEDGRWQPRTPAMAAGLADHVWSLEEWLSFLTVQAA